MDLEGSVAKMQRDTEPRYGEGHWTIHELQILIQNKITERTARATVEKQDAYKLFGRPVDGITEKIFRRQLRKWGINLSAKDNAKVFRHFDATANGTISFQELVQKLMPKDYTSKTWNVFADERNDAHEVKIRKDMISNRASAPLKMDIDSLRNLIQTKILERTKHGTTEIVDAYKLFGRPQYGITPQMFEKQMTKFGIYLTSEQVEHLFQEYDKNGSGTLTFQEFIQGIMPRDYTAKSWNILADEKADAVAKKELDKKLKKKSRRRGHREKIPPLHHGVKPPSHIARNSPGRVDSHIETTIPSLAVSQIKLTK